MKQPHEIIEKLLTIEIAKLRGKHLSVADTYLADRTEANKQAMLKSKECLEDATSAMTWIASKTYGH